MVKDWLDGYRSQQRGMSMEEALLHARDYDVNRSPAGVAKIESSPTDDIFYQNNSLVRQVMVNMDRLANVQWGRLPVGSGAESDDPPRIEYIDKPMTRAELQADTERLNRQVIADLQQYVSVLCGMPLPVGSAIESATEGLPPKPYPPGPYPPPAPPPLAAHRMVSVKDDHAVHGPDGLRIFAGRGHKGKWRAEIIAAALDGRWADAQWAKGVIDD